MIACNERTLTGFLASVLPRHNRLNGFILLKFFIKKNRADLGFSRGVGGLRIFKIQNLFELFWTTKLIFWALSNHCKDPILTRFSALRQITVKTLFWPDFLRYANIFDAKKAFLGLFLEIVDQTKFFSARACPSKLVYFSAFRTILGSVSRKLISQSSTKGDPLGRQGVESPRFSHAISLKLLKIYLRKNISP